MADLRVCCFYIFIFSCACAVPPFCPFFFFSSLNDKFIMEEGNLVDKNVVDDFTYGL